MAKAKGPKIYRPKAQTPKGFRDYFGNEVKHRDQMLSQIADIYYQYGFDPLETSAVETVEALGKFLPDVDRPNDGVFAWVEEDDTWLALRYDLTAPLARVAAQYRNDLPNPYRRYAMGPVWRNEKPGIGRYRQFYQCDADTVGASSIAADAEICMMLGDVLSNVGMSYDDFTIKLNNRKIMNGALEVAGLWNAGDPNLHMHERGIALRAIDKLDRLGEAGVAQLLGKGRKDDSGDYTEGAGLSDDQITTLLAFTKARGKDDTKTLENLEDIVGSSTIGAKGVAELAKICELTVASKSSQVMCIDPSVVRGLGYYTGPVFEAELTFEIMDEKGRPRQFGSVAGGGRYDDLVKRFTGQEVPATGVSIGVDRLLAALYAHGDLSSVSVGPVLVTVMDKDQLPSYQDMVTELREAGIRAELFMGNGNVGKQMKYADKRNSPLAIVQGSDERASDEVQIKDLELGSLLASELVSNEEWKAQPAQTKIARSDLVAEISKRLGRNLNE